ncbi:MAG: DUF58 domain-containing protein [Oscillospiraceae bacterium]
MLIIYIILWIVSAVLYIVYDDTLILYLFTFLLILPIVLFVLLKMSSKKISVGFCEDRQVSVRNNKIPLQIKIINNSFLPIGNLKIKIKYRSSNNKETNVLKINSPVFSKETQKLKLNVNAVHYGNMYFEIESCVITDMLRLFRQKLKNNSEILKTDVIVVPDYINVENNIADYENLSLESDKFSPYKKGNDPSEIFDVHEYVYGDRINRIHWNLSARQDKTMVKDYSSGISYAIVMLIDMHFDKNNQNSLVLYDALIESVSAVSYYLIENSVPHKIMLYNEKSESILAYEQTNEDDYQHFIYDLVNMEIADIPNGSLTGFLDSDFNQHCGHFLYFSSNYSTNVLNAIQSNSLAEKNTFVLISSNSQKLDVEGVETVVADPYNIADSVGELCL